MATSQFEGSEFTKLITANVEIARLRAILRRADLLCKVALPKFDWGKSALTAEAIALLNEVPGEIAAAIKS